MQVKETCKEPSAQARLATGATAHATGPSLRRGCWPSFLTWGSTAVADWLHVSPGLGRWQDVSVGTAPGTEGRRLHLRATAHHRGHVNESAFRGPAPSGDAFPVPGCRLLQRQAEMNSASFRLRGCVSPVRLGRQGLGLPTPNGLRAEASVAAQIRPQVFHTSNKLWPLKRPLRALPAPHAPPACPTCLTCTHGEQSAQSRGQKGMQRF